MNRSSVPRGNPSFRRKPESSSFIKRTVRSALKEDKAWSDVTSRSLVDPKTKITAEIIAKQEGILCGTLFAKETFKTMDNRCQVAILRRDREKIFPNTKVLIIKGSALNILAAERTALNFLQHCSGIATLTGRFVASIKDTGAKIYDTRKTIPGIRSIQKYAVLCGGGRNHRMNLEEFALVKDTTLSAIGNDRQLLLSVKKRLPKGKILEMEAENMADLQLALDARADMVLLDNWDTSNLKKAVQMIRSYSRKLGLKYPLIEVSGGISLKSVRKIALSGVDRISVGALTHSAPALDLSMKIISIE